MTNPTGYTELDLVGFTDKGEYSSSANYVKNDIVQYNYVAWRCKVDDTTGITPTEGTNWTVFVGDPLFERLMANNAGAHNAIYRGKALGSSVTSAQYNAIDAGTFEDLYIGDYWTIDGVNYRIAAFDYWLHCGDTECTKHHVVIVPDTNLYSAKMNDSNITTGGYVGSKMYTDSLATAKTTIKNAFGAANILSHREYLVNAVTNGKPSAGSWYDSDIELMNERMVYGCPVFVFACDGSTVPYLNTIDKSQLPLFALDPSRICNRAYWWLRDVVSAVEFADVAGAGAANYNIASVSHGVRPAFAIYRP